MCQDCAELGQCFWVYFCGVFFPFFLAGPEQELFSVSSGLFFSQQSSFLAHHLLVRAAALWQHHLCPCAQLAVSCCPLSHDSTCTPSSLSFPSMGTGSCLGSAQGWGCQAPPVPVCWHRVALVSRSTSTAPGCPAREPWGVPTLFWGGWSHPR